MLVRTAQYRKGIVAQFLYVGLQTAVWSFTIRVALELYPGMNEREATNYMIAGFTCFLLGKFVANGLIARYSAARVLVVYCAIGAVLLTLAAFGPASSAIWFVIASNLVMGPCWPTIFGQTLDTIEDKRYQETAGAILVMAIVGGAVIPVVQGAVSDVLGSLQMSFVVSALCFLGILLYFRSNLRHHVADEPSSPEPSSKSSSPSSLVGMVKCCQVPSRSQNLRSTASTLLSLANLSTSLGVCVAMRAPPRAPRVSRVVTD